MTESIMVEALVTHCPFYEHELAGRYLVESFIGARGNWRDTVFRATELDNFVRSLR